MLDAAWRKHLEDLRTREKRSDWNEEDEVFFEHHRRFIEQNKQLHARWEKVVFGKPIECHDFLDGFAEVAPRLTVGDSEPKGERFLRFTVTKGRTEWRERFNGHVGAFFSAMYRGLKELMGSHVEWRVTKMGSGDLPDPLFDHPAFIVREKEFRGTKFKGCSSLAKTAVRIKFEVSLIEKSGASETVLKKTQLVWIFRPDSIGLSLVDDMRRLQEKGSVGCTEVPSRWDDGRPCGGVRYRSVSASDASRYQSRFPKAGRSGDHGRNRDKCERPEIGRDSAMISPSARGAVCSAYGGIMPVGGQKLMDVCA